MLVIAGGILLALLILWMLPELLGLAGILVVGLLVVAGLLVVFAIGGGEGVLVALLVGGLYLIVDNADKSKRSSFPLTTASDALNVSAENNKNPELNWEGLVFFWSLYRCTDPQQFLNYLKLLFTVAIGDRRQLNRKREMNAIVCKAKEAEFRVLERDKLRREAAIAATEAHSLRLENEVRVKADKALASLENRLDAKLEVFIEEQLIVLIRKDLELTVKTVDDRSIVVIDIDKRAVIGEPLCNVNQHTAELSGKLAPMSVSKASRVVHKLVRKALLK